MYPIFSNLPPDTLACTLCDLKPKVTNYRNEVKNKYNFMSVPNY